MIFERYTEGMAPLFLLRARDRAAVEAVKQLVPGEPVELELLHPRDAFEQRKIFAQLAEVAKAIDMDPELLRAQLLFETNNYTPVGELFGKEVIALNSMSRRHMSDRRFHQFWGQAKEVIRAKMLCRVRDDAARQHLARMLSP